MKKLLVILLSCIFLSINCLAVTNTNPIYPDSMEVKKMVEIEINKLNLEETVEKKLEKELNEKYKDLVKTRVETVKNTIVDGQNAAFVYNVDQIVQGVQAFYDNAWQTLLGIIAGLGTILAFILNKISKTRVDDLEKKMEETLTLVNSNVSNITSNIITLTKQSLESHVEKVSSTKLEIIESELIKSLKTKQSEHLSQLEKLADDIEKDLNEKFLNLKQDLTEISFPKDEFAAYVVPYNEENDEG